MVKKKLLEFNSSTRCLNTKQYDLDTVYSLCKTADKIKHLCQTIEGSDHVSSILRNKRAMLYFNQPSTRTFLSFQNACYILGIKCSEIRDTTTSSAMKGETESDTVKTFSEYVDLVIMRHPTSNFIKEVAEILPTEKIIINAGSGTDEHPTQALLDFYTIYKYGFDKKKIAFMGDLKRSRTVRSLALLLDKLEGLTFYFIAPKAFQVCDDILSQLNNKYVVSEELDSLLPELDVIYVTRLQDEYGGIDEKFDRMKYSITKENVSKLKKKAIILHPLPRREEIATEIDSDERAKYFEQVNNGMWMRAALILTMFGQQDKL